MAGLRRRPLSRTYGASLQSSLTSVLPSALDYSSRLPVSVLVRTVCFNPTEVFLDVLQMTFPSNGVSLAARDLSNRPLTIQTPSLFRSTHRRGNINPLSIVYAFRPRLRNRLTLGGITYPRKP